MYVRGQAQTTNTRKAITVATTELGFLVCVKVVSMLYRSVGDPTALFTCVDYIIVS